MGLQQRHGTFFARLTVPEALRQTVGKRELRERLGTDRRQAERNVHAAMARLEDQLAAARRARTPTPPPQRRRPQRSFEQIVRELYAEWLAADERRRNAPRVPIDMGDGLVVDADELDWLAEVLQPTDIDGMKRIAAGRAPDERIIASDVGFSLRRLMDEGEVTCSLGSDEWRYLARLLAQVKLEAIARGRERDEGNFAGRPSLPLLAEAPSPVQTSNREPDLRPESHLSVSEIVQLVHAEKVRLRPATKQEQVVAARMFEETLERTLPIRDINRRHALAYKNALMEAPALYTLRFPGEPLPRAIDLNKRRTRPFPTLSAKTINGKWLMHVASIFTWALRNDIVSSNPFRGIRVDLGGYDSEERPRLPFTAEEAKRIFAHPSFTGAGDERRWSVLIAAYSGMRAGEVAQLRLDGIREQRGVLVFTVDGQVKTAGSRRIVPVHSTLVASGITERVERLRASGAAYLFPEWMSRVEGLMASAKRRSKVIQPPHSTIHPRWFVKQLLPKLGLDDGRHAFHSWRHSAKTIMKVAGVPRDVRNEVTGHIDPSVAGSYEHGISIEALRDAIEKVRYV